jgi:hypothetical protein
MHFTHPNYAVGTWLRGVSGDASDLGQMLMNEYESHRFSHNSCGEVDVEREALPGTRIHAWADSAPERIESDRGQDTNHGPRRTGRWHCSGLAWPAGFGAWDESARPGKSGERRQRHKK